MYCKKCGKEYPKDKKVCKTCGIALTSGKSPDKKDKSNLKIIIAGCAVLAAIVLLFVIIGFGGMLPQQLKGVWYDKSGLMGTVEFEPGGKVKWNSGAGNSMASYSYNAGSGEGVITLPGEENGHAFTCDGSALILDGVTYTK